MEAKRVYGWSWKNNNDQYMVFFETEEAAEKWLNTEEYDFRERELLTEREAIKIMGKSAFEDWEEKECRCNF